jgi:hypothetical protein
MTENWLQKYKDLADKSAEGHHKPTEAHKQAQESGKEHNEDLKKEQLLHRRAAFESNTPRNLQVSGTLGRPELTETGPDGKVITHIQGINAPDAAADVLQKAQSSELSSADVIRMTKQLLAQADTGSAINNQLEPKDHNREQIADNSKESEASERGGPFKHKEKEELAKTTKADKQAWEHAHDAFPETAGVPTKLMEAYTLNEIKFYHLDDQVQDLLAANGHDGGWTLGLAQITTKGVREFEEKYPQLKKFLKDHGYGPGQEMKALLDPACVPMIVAAKTATIVEDLNKHHVPITAETVAYGYNPDVFSYSNNKKGRDYVAIYGRDHIEASNSLHPDQKKEYYANAPAVVHASKHIKNVLNALEELDSSPSV